MEKLSFKEKAETKLLESASPVYNGIHSFGSLLRSNAKSAVSSISNYLHSSQHVPDFLNKVQTASASCVSCGSPVCTVTFGAAAIIPLLVLAKEKIYLFGGTVVQHLRF